MKKNIKLLIIVHLFYFGCSSSENYFHTYYDKDYKVLDRGGKSVILISKACSISLEKANLEARRYAKFQLRSIMGSDNHVKKLKKIRNYNEGQKRCVEIIAK